VPAGEQLERLLALLAQDPHAPTTIRQPERVVDDHLADSLVALELEPVRRAGSVVDLGSGAGLPGLPLAIALPRTSFSLIESVGRKCVFIERAAAATSLRNVEVIHARAEAWRPDVRQFELAVARAVADLSVVLEYAAPLLPLGGCLVVWRGRRDASAEGAADRAAQILGLEVGEVRRVQPYPQAEERHLHLFLKIRETPARFPRRAGVAAKRPLGRQ
jgi:16S rRNA (guanine527-N7)-methyltransferase